MTVRKQEYDRIARENQAIMQRILQREPHFNRAALDEDWKVTQRYLRNISEYPFILGNLPPATRKKTLKPIELEDGAGAMPEAEASAEQIAAEDASSGVAQESQQAAAAEESAAGEEPLSELAAEEPAAEEPATEESAADQPAAEGDGADDE